MAHHQEVQYIKLRRIPITDTTAGETIPIRLFLGGFDLTPTFREVNKKYSTRYYLSLVLIDEGVYAMDNLTQASLTCSKMREDTSNNPRLSYFDRRQKA